MIPQAAEFKNQLGNAIEEVLRLIEGNFPTAALDAFILIQSDAYCVWGSAIHRITDPNKSPIACEWEGWGFGSEAFYDLSTFVEGFRDDLYDFGELEPNEIESSFMFFTIEVIQKFKRRGKFAIPQFTSDPLLGLQTHDMGPQDQIIEVSLAVNSNSNHHRLVEAVTTY